jgi:hypothetical protein
MDTDTSEDYAGMRPGEFERGTTGSQVGARIYYARHSPSYSSLDSSFAIGIKARSIDMCVAIDKHYNISFPNAKRQKKGRQKISVSLSQVTLFLRSIISAYRGVKLRVRRREAHFCFLVCFLVCSLVGTFAIFCGFNSL